MTVYTNSASSFESNFHSRLQFLRFLWPDVLLSIGKTILYNLKEAHNHTFSHKVGFAVLRADAILTDVRSDSELGMVDIAILYSWYVTSSLFLRAQFARRDNVYYQSSAVKAQDAFVIICTITASPSTPPLPPALPVQSVPKSLLDTVGALLDDPVYCDVEFVIPRRSQSLKDARRIKASRRLLKRAEYFDTSKHSPLYLIKYY